MRMTRSAGGWAAAAACGFALAALASPLERPTVDLSGEWEFRIDPYDIGRDQKWFEEGVSWAGLVDMFLRPKAFLPAEFQTFNAPTVLLLDAPRRNWWSGETAAVKLLVSRFEDDPSDTAQLRWELRRATEILASGLQERIRISTGGVQQILPLRLEMPQWQRATRRTLAAELIDTNGMARNSWDLWLFPSRRSALAGRKVRFCGADTLRQLQPGALEAIPQPALADTDLLVTTRLDQGTLSYLKEGGRVLLLEPAPAFAVEKTNFRLSSWDGGGPSGTVVAKTHPALRDMPTESWCDLQFYHLIQGSKTIALDPLPVKIQPLVRCIDRPTRLANRAYLFEISVGQGKLLVSGFNFTQAVELKDPAGLHLLDGLIRYALGSDFMPEAALAEEALKGETTK